MLAASTRPSAPPLSVEAPVSRPDTRFLACGGAAVAVAVIASALVINTAALDQVSAPKLHVILLGAGVATACWLWWRRSSGRAPLPSALAIRTLLLLGVALFSTIASRSPRLSIWGLPTRYNGLVPLAAYLAVLVVVAAGSQHQRSIARWMCVAVVLGAALMSVYVLIQRAGLDWTSWHDPQTQQPADWATGTVGNSNFAGGYLAIALPLLAVAFFALRRPVWEAAAGALFGLVSLALWYTQTRGGLIAAALGLFLMLWATRQRLEPWLKRGLGALALTGATVAIITVFHPGMAAPPGPLRSIRTSTLSYRVQFWGAAIHIAADHPMLGTGPDTFYAEYLRYRPTSEANANGLSIPDKPHSVPLEYASNLGLLGFAAWAALAGGGICVAWRSIRRSTGKPDLLLVACLGAYLAYLAQSAVSMDEPPLAIAGWVLLGALYGLAGRASTRRGRAATSEGRSRRLLFGALAVLVLITSVGVATAFLRSSLDARRGDFAAARRLQPFDPSYFMRDGDRMQAMAAVSNEPASGDAWLKQADERYRSALALQPDNLILLLRLAELNTTWAERGNVQRIGVAKSWWDRAQRLDHHDRAVVGQADEAMQRLRGRAVELHQVADAAKDDSGRWEISARAYMGLGDSVAARADAERAVAADPANQSAQALVGALNKQSASGAVKS